MRLFGFHVTPVCFSLRMVDFYTATGCFLYPPSRITGAPLLHQPGICLSRLISRVFFFSPDTFSPATARRYTIPPPLHTARIRTGHDSGTASPSAHSTLSPPAPVYPSPALYTPAAASLHPPRLARNLKYLTILKNVSGMCCFSLATSSRCVSVSVAVSPVLWSR